MKRLTKMLHGYARPLAALLVIAMLFTACKKEDTPGLPQPPVAGLMAFNLAPDKAGVGFTLSNNPLPNTVLNYTDFTGVYMSIFAGNREVRSVDYTGSTIATTNANFTDSNYYSVFVVGNNGSYKNVVVRDELQSITAAPGKAWVRYVNAITDSTAAPMVNIGEGAISGTAAYASVSSFGAVNAGAVNITVNNGGSINASRTITLEANKIYTVLLVGVPGSTEPGKQVQIKFITNGTATP